MATRCSMGGSVFLLLLLSVSLVDGINLKEACAKTPYPEVCMTHLSNNENGIDINTTNERGLAQIATGVAVYLAYPAAKAARNEAHNINEKPRQWCMRNCALKMELAASSMMEVDDKLYVMDDQKFNDVRRFIESTEKDPAKWKWNCDDCREAPAKPDLISKNNDFEKFMGVICALFKQTPGGNVPLPPAPPPPKTLE